MWVPGALPRDFRSFSSEEVLYSGLKSQKCQSFEFRANKNHFSNELDYTNTKRKKTFSCWFDAFSHHYGDQF